MKVPPHFLDEVSRRGADKGWIPLVKELSWVSRVDGNLNEDENLV